MNLPTICQKSLTFISSKKSYGIFNFVQLFFKRNLFPSLDSTFPKYEMSQNSFPKGNPEILTMTFPIPYISYHSSSGVMICFVKKGYQQKSRDEKQTRMDLNLTYISGHWVE